MLQLTEQQSLEVLRIVNSIIDEPHAVFAYGSRTKDQARPYSDLDLLVRADEKLPIEKLYKLKDAFEFSDLPFRVDVQDWYALNDSFKHNIESSLIKLN
ncbi:nucleotidyltransferase family protein [Thiomicrorhabdus xiamenensis]|uniref:Nucleotidyltransferase domain-containing protein n=1 Tax=Thiomicrorhabdus xiamenensis TaxID=2739063 RepID=A0A7D4NQ01_9GAMM|nr:nucleotidyltransferase domain-containing protein [Thiomicrorhabdus xiamenensis]QKI88290.1 nucleotidyltransferase domain-containing protein [Thiomicrorhabdus xiamenensis]